LPCFRVNTPTTYPLQLFPPAIPKMSTAQTRNPKIRPLACACARGGSSGWLARVRTQTLHPLNSIPCELANMATPPHKNRFGYEQMNQPTGYEGNLSAPKHPNLFTIELHHTLSRHHVNVFTGKHVNQFQGKPANHPSGSHGNTQELNMSSTFRCKHENTLTTLKVNS